MGTRAGIERSGRIGTVRENRKLFPVLDLELRLLLLLPVVDLELEVLRADALLELESRTALVVAFVRALAGEERDELVLADLEVAEIQPLHAAFQERLGFARRIEIVRYFLLV